MCQCCCSQKSRRSVLFYTIAVCLGIAFGLSDINILEKVGIWSSEIFIRLFKCISMPVISLSVIVALSGYDSDQSMVGVWRKTLFYTLATTIIAASLSALLYVIISPANVNSIIEESRNLKPLGADYSKYLLEIVPDNILNAFIERKVLSVLLISVIFGIAIRFIKENDAKTTVVTFFRGLHSVFFTITRFIVKILPIGLFGFVTVSILELKKGMDLGGMGSYFFVIIIGNILQGVLVLPIFLMIKEINPIKMIKSMLSALSVAFFSKSSLATLPITIETMEKNLNINPKISRFTLPLCTTINMNGCATFIFTTVVYIMQNNGIEITPFTLITWVLIATLAAVGNAGVPMGCFFLSASLLSSMDIPMPLMGIILPFYGVIDMIETSLNVWSDSCVTAIVDKELSAHK